MMKAAMFYGPENGKVEEVPVPVAGPGELVIKNQVALTCGTDVKTYVRGYPLFKPPYGFGHEAAGVVAQVGEGVVGFQVGDRVVAHNSAPCNVCFYCKQGQHSMCDHITFNQGAFAEYEKIPAAIVKQNVFHIPDTMDFADAALVEPFSCAVYGIDQIGIEAGDTVVVNGAGPIGLMFVRLAHYRGARVIATDLSDERLALAENMGAAVTINPGQAGNAVEIVRSHTENQRGVDVAIEAVGQTELWEKTINMARKGGKVLLFGGTKAGTAVSIDANLLHYSQLTIKGVFHTTPRHVQIAFDLIKNGMITARDFVGNRYPLDEIEKAILSHKSGKVIKNCIVFD
jgi:L-iditol 2-dehydrogenase